MHLSWTIVIKFSSVHAFVAPLNFFLAIKKLQYKWHIPDNTRRLRDDFVEIISLKSQSFETVWERGKATKEFF